MRMYPLLLVTAVTISAFTDATSTRPSSTLKRSASPPQQAVQRLLRDGTDSSKEERMFAPSTFAKTEEFKVNASIENYQHLLPRLGHDMPMNNQLMSFWREVTSKHEGKETLVASILAHRYGVDDFLAMLEKFKTDEATTEFATKLEDWWIKSRVEEGGTPSNNDLIGVLKLISPDDNILDSPRFNAYLELLRKEHTTNIDDMYLAMAIDLSSRYNTDDAFKKMLEAAEPKSPTARYLSTKLYANWITITEKKDRDVSIVRVLKILNLDYNVLSSPRFKAYFKLMNEKYATNEGDLYQAIATDLSSRYKTDDAFLKMLEFAKEWTNDRVTTDLATKLQDGWITSKIKEAGVPTNKVINHVLTLMHYDDNKLSSSRLDGYYKLMKKVYPEDEDDLYLAMAIDWGSRYNTDNAFVRMLEAVIQSPVYPAMKDLAAKLDTEWKISRGEMSGIDLDESIDRVLKLIRPDDNVLSSPRFTAYHELMKKVYGTDTNDLYLAMATNLESRYNTNEAFVKMLDNFKTEPTTKALATRMHDAIVASG